MIWKLTETIDLNQLQHQFDWIMDMHDVPQSTIYHGEGNVFIHTQMVLNELVQLEEFHYLTKQEQQILIAAALLHDVEKRSTTLVESPEKISSKGHAKKGEYTARSLLYQKYNAPFKIRETIAKLVKYHGLPFWIFNRNNPSQYLAKVSLEVDTNLLCILAEADMKGRICKDLSEMLYRLELFKELCRENQCYGKPKFFASSTTRFAYFNKKDISPDYKLYDNTKFEVVLMSGLPGTGKDTYIQSKYPNWPIVSLDAIRETHKIAPTDKKGNGKVIQLAKEKAKTYMRAHQSFVWNATNITTQMRQQLVQLFVEYKAMVTIVYIEVPYSKLLQQNQNRIDVVPEKIVNKLLHKLEIPSLSEAHLVHHVYEDT